MIKVFISSPYSNGDVTKNVELQVNVGNQLMDNGFLPFAPLLYHAMAVKKERPYDFWIEFTAAWVSDCDALLRVGGESSGTDNEVKLANSKNIPVFHSVEELIKFYNNII